MSDQTDKNTGPDRRTLVKAAAWSVPIIAAAVASPARAASGDPAVRVFSDPLVGAAGIPWSFGAIPDPNGTVEFQPGTTATVLIDRTSGGGDAFAVYDAWALSGATVAEIAPTQGPSPQLAITLTGIASTGFGINTTGQTSTTVTITVMGPQGDVIGSDIVRSV
ncbi:hypothetical protein [Microbacterium sp. NPDC057650]|uniref:hypothetical protein n=1 Tax=unclassified Microbacterium TaxID=2609290 RepID=UPI003673551A